MGPSETFGLGETPEVLQRIGAENLPIVMTQAVMEKITGGKHDIGLDELKKLPRNLADPLMVFESSTVKGAYVILTEMTDKSGDAVVAALHIKRTENHHTVNRVASVYGKEGIERFIHTETKKGHLRYIDKNKSQQWSQSRGLQLPKLADTITDKNNILQKEDIVNSSIRETGGNDTRYSLESTAEADMGADTAYLSEPAERIRNDVEAVRLRAEARKGKTYTQDEIRQVCVSILDNIDAGTGRGLSMTRKDKAAMMILANRALHAGGDAAAEPHIRRLAAFTAQKALVQDASEYFDYKRTLSHLRDTVRHSISLTEADKQTLDGMLGEAAAGYKAFYGGGTRGVDAVYDELSEARPDLYPANLTTESAKLQKITEVHQWLREGAEAKNERLLDILKEDDRAAFAELVREQISGAMREGGRPSRLSAELQAAEARRQQDLARMRERYEKKISNMREKVRSREKARLAARSIEPLEYIRPESLTAAAEEYGRMKQGETPARDIAVPKKISKKQYVSRFARTMLEAGVTPAEAVSEFEKRILDGTMTYERVTDKSAKAWVDRYLRGRSFSEALKYWNNLIDAGARVDKNHMALGMALYNQCVNAKDAQNAMKIAADLARTATQAGQTVQAVRILKQMSPDAQLYDLEQSVDKINADLKKRLGKKYREIEIDEKLAQEYLTAESEEQRDEVMERITAQVAAQIPATVRDKLDAWRYLSMLANPRTHIRNIVGNAVFVPAVELKNAIGAAMEKAIPKGQRTKAVTRAAGTVEFASKDFKNIEKAAAGNSSRFNEMAEGIENQRTIFKTKPLEKLRKLNFDLLELEDVIFLKRAYVSSLSGAMTARGYTPEFLSSGTLEANQTLEKLPGLCHIRGAAGDLPRRERAGEVHHTDPAKGEKQQECGGQDGRTAVRGVAAV